MVHLLRFHIRENILSLYEGAKTKVRVGAELSEEFCVKVGVHQGSILFPFLLSSLKNESIFNLVLSVSEWVVGY